MPVDYSNYPEEWFDIIRPAVLKRDNYHCKRCGIAHRQHIVRYGSHVIEHVPDHKVARMKDLGHKVERIFLQVAHLDHDVSNNEMYNLLSMCPACHNKYDARHRAMSRRISAANKGK